LQVAVRVVVLQLTPQWVLVGVLVDIALLPDPLAVVHLLKVLFL
jgi:hypothetical protein